jgi:hypothetical protein
MLGINSTCVGLADRCGQAKNCVSSRTQHIGEVQKQKQSFGSWILIEDANRDSACPHSRKTTGVWSFLEILSRVAIVCWSLYQRLLFLVLNDGVAISLAAQKLQVCSRLPEGNALCG